MNDKMRNLQLNLGESSVENSKLTTSRHRQRIDLSASKNKDIHTLEPSVIANSREARDDPITFSRKEQIKFQHLKNMLDFDFEKDKGWPVREIPSITHEL